MEPLWSAPERPSNEAILDQVDYVNTQLTNQIDRAIINFFGSREVAEKEFKNYVLESYPYEIETWIPSDPSNNEFKLSTTQRIRIRRKTEEELAEESSQDLHSL